MHASTSLRWTGPVRRLAVATALATVAGLLVAGQPDEDRPAPPAPPSAGTHHHDAGHEMAGMVQPSPAAYVADDVVLDRAGWSASAAVDAAGEGTGHVAAPATVDDEPGTAWVAPDAPARLTIDLGAVATVSGLDYAAPSDGAGAITRFAVATSVDGTSWTTVARGRWPQDGRAVPTDLVVTTARFVRLTALEVARGDRAVVVDVGLRSPAPTEPTGPGTPGTTGTTGTTGRAAPARRVGPPSSVGRWGPVIGFPIVPVAVAALPGNRLLTWSAYATNDYEPQGEGYTQTSILDLDTMRVDRRRVSRTHHDMFCPGVAMMPNGRVMVTGGSNATETSFYDPRRNRWYSGPPMNVGRGYHAMTLMPKGGVFTVGGSWGNEAGLGGKVGEVWTPRGGWRRLPGVPPRKMLTDDPAGIFRSDNQMWLYPVAHDRVLQIGPSRAMNLISTRGRGWVRTVGRRPGIDQMNGNAVMFAPQRLLVLGGAAAYDQSPSTTRAFVVDIGGRAPRVQQTGSMRQPRSFANSVVLPDGEVVAVGGQSVPLPFTDQDARLQPEIWNPGTGRFRLGAPMSVPRTYHSVAVLLADGRVFAGGGGLCGKCQTNHFNGQVYTPGYLLDDDGSLRDRPRIRTAPRTVRAGSRFVVRTDREVRSFALVRRAEATHTVNNSQRRIPLRVLRRQGNTYTLRVPRRQTVSLPGGYMLFAMDGRGTPSVSRPVTVPVR